MGNEISSRTKDGKKVSYNIKYSLEKTFQKSSKKIQQVGPLLSIKQKAKEYQNEKIIQLLLQFETQYPFYREVKGDGNCFYRSVFVQYIEQLISLREIVPLEVERRLSEMMDAGQDIFKVVMRSTIPTKFEKYLEQLPGLFFYGMQQIAYDIIETNKPKATKIDQLIQFVNQYPIFDFSSILLMRLFALKGLEKFTEQLTPFFMGNEREIILNFSIEAQNCVVKLICEYLNIPISIQSVTRENINEVEFFPEFSKQSPGSTGLSPIFLFFRPGHYDICYARKYSSQVYIQESKMNLSSTIKSISAQKDSKIITKEQDDQFTSNIKIFEESKLASPSPSQIIQSTPHTENKCFFCFQNIVQAINLMNICENCYYSKIGDNFQSGICKICKCEIKDKTKPYCLCLFCEENYFNFEKFENKVEIQLSNEKGMQNISCQHQKDYVIVDIIKPKKNKLLSINEQGCNSFQYAEDEGLYKNVNNTPESKEVRCVLCLNLEQNPKSIICKGHFICESCQGPFKSMEGLCACSQFQ